MQIVVVFLNVGPYHAARLRAAHSACRRRGWSLNAIQVTDHQTSHPWGNIEREISFSLTTLLPGTKTGVELTLGPSSLAASAELRRCLEQWQPSAMFVPSWGCPVSRAALQWSRRRGVPAIVMSETKQDDRQRRWWKEWLKARLFARHFRAALVGGSASRDYLVSLGIPSERVFLGYDAVDNERFAEGARIARQNPMAVREREPAIPTRPYFLGMTRFVMRKNVPQLIRAYAAYRTRVGSADAWDLVLCGDGPDRSTITDLVADQSLSSCVHLPGFVPYQTLGDWYGMAGAFVHPALDEPWGLVINEACASALPVLCSRTVGASRELVMPGQNGFLFDPRDTEEMTQSMLRLHRLSATDRAELGRRGQEIAADFGPARFAKGFVSALETALSSSTATVSLG